MEYFVQEDSIVRKVWGKADTILFIFAGASAEFALNKAVDWLYFTGRLPADPLARLFSTVSYARQIIFLEKEKALKAIDTMRSIHAAVEASRDARIPDWAYRDVLFMLIHYSIASFELLERKLTSGEKQDLFDVFYRVGLRMQLKGLPNNFDDWVTMREEHLKENLHKSNYTIDLFKQYRKHLGAVRFKLLKESQKLVVPNIVNTLLGLGKIPMLKPLVPLYKFSRMLKLDGVLKSLFLPDEYKKEIRDLDVLKF